MCSSIKLIDPTGRSSISGNFDEKICVIQNFHVQNSGLKCRHFILMIFYVSRLSIECDEPSENLDNHGGQTESTPVEKHYFIWTNKGVRLYPKYQLYRVLIEGPYI